MVHAFIVNPKCAPKGYSAWLREELSQVPGLNYYVLTSREAGYEKELVRIVERTFEGEALRFYCCGGSGTARNIVDAFSDINREELAIIPLGRVDYLRGFGDISRFMDVHELIDGEIMHVDYLKSNHGVALNTMSVGLDTSSLRAGDSLRGFRAFGKKVPEIMSAVYATLFGSNFQYDIHVNDNHIIQRCSQVSLSNIPVLGGNLVYSTDKDITDGYGTCLITPALSIGQKILLRIKLLKKEANIQHGDYGINILKASAMHIRRSNGAPFWMNLDGELVSEVDWDIEVVYQGLRLVVPKRKYYEK